MWEMFGANTDLEKADLCLAGIIAVFLALTLLAYLLNEGKSQCLIPLCKRFCPKCTWIRNYEDMIDEDCQQLLWLEMGLSQHVLGVKKANRQV